MEGFGSTSTTSSPQQRWLTIAAALILAAAAAGTAEANIAQDKEECASKLMVLAPCLAYVMGNAKAPTLDCCSGLKQVIQKDTKCLCLLIKDRDDPSLGVKVNISLAANLPSSCHAPANISDCLSILHLAPNSADARKFDGLDDLIGKGGGGGGGSNATTDGGGPAAGSTGSGRASGGGGEPENQKSGGRGKETTGGWRMEMAVVVGIWGVITATGMGRFF